MQTGNTNYICKNDLGKACFQHNITYCRYKDSTKVTTSDNFLRDKSFEIVSNPKYDGYQRGLASMVYKFFDKSFFSFLVLNPCQINNMQKKFIKQLLENLKEEKSILHSRQYLGC